MHDTLRLLCKKLLKFSTRACQRLVGHPISSLLNTTSLQHAPPARDAQIKVSRFVWNTKTRHACGLLAGAVESPCGYTCVFSCSRHLLAIFSFAPNTHAALSLGLVLCGAYMSSFGASQGRLVARKQHHHLMMRNGHAYSRGLRSPSPRGSAVLPQCRQRVN
ncbi:hypothetical protein BKA81DRAFT_85001 [Phyllosticta paracitricarpa]